MWGQAHGIIGRSINLCGMGDAGFCATSVNIQHMKSYDIRLLKIFAEKADFDLGEDCADPDNWTKILTDHRESCKICI